ncbi:sigma-70 family RNA polymerase sigma factor [Cytobacillus sp. Sa5YUA1]|uniref:Sigma-70 family RNA polymerase sigma factor n=2 Tax=Cytobacillus stercorigallinarum TaxID=2762240 RepID=A0ABR8QS62_9BACI|nr:sigma-70 family RNA polymerase sigma factor [Cytobacillus stercorigallinarum]
MDNYGEALTKLAFNYLKDWNLAEDVIQDVFIICYKHYDKLEEIHSLKAWLYRVTINKSKDILKHSNRKRMIFNSSILEFKQGKERSPETQMIHNNERLFLSASVLSLPIKYREVIILYYYDGLSIAEMSHILKLNENTLKTRLKRARAKLRVLMEGGEANGKGIKTAKRNNG